MTLESHTERVVFTPRDMFHLTEGLRIEWCTKHGASFFNMDRCGSYLFDEPIYDGDPDPGECVVASRVLVDLPIWDDQ